MQNFLKLLKTTKFGTTRYNYTFYQINFYLIIGGNKKVLTNLGTIF